MKKIILDTDIGSDIDDVLCLTYLLKQRQCNLLGITTVSGDNINRAKIASALCRHQGRGDIPIYPGIENPIFVPQRQKIAHQAKKLENWPHDKEFPENCSAIEFMRSTIRKHPGEVYIIAIGPLTNIATLFIMDPEIPKLLAGIYVMGGRFTMKQPGATTVEWNILCDPHAAQIVFSKNIKEFYVAGLDVTCDLKQSNEEMQRCMQGDVYRPVLDFAQVWFEKREFIVYHDPLVAAILFDREICTYVRSNITVELKSDVLLGYTMMKQNDDGLHSIACNVNSERFFNHYFGVINGTL